jgi:hypothetical protein
MNAANHIHRKVLLGLKAIRDTDNIICTHHRAYRIPTDASRMLLDSFFVAQVTTSLIRYFHPRLMPLFHYTIKQHY